MRPIIPSMANTGRPLTAATDLRHLLARNPAAAIYLTVCWKDSCSAQVELDDPLGLCAPHREQLRAGSE